MKRTLNDITNKYQKKDDNEDKSINRSKDKDHDQVKTKRPTSAGKFYTLGKVLNELNLVDNPEALKH